MAGFGPNGRCFGDGRCRCRRVPTGAAGSRHTPPVGAGGGAGSGGGGVPPAPPGGEPPGFDPRRIPGAENAWIPPDKVKEEADVLFQ